MVPRVLRETRRPRLGRMQDDSLRTHAESFSAGADRYDEHRPSYPAETVRWLLGEARDVLDLGAGTGKLTAELAALGARVTAVDPSADMLRVLHERLPDVATLVGTGERIPLADASVDLVTVAQAWHWVEPTRTSAEVLRVLRPTGTLALIWNSRDESVDWVGALSEAMHPGLHESGTYVPPLGSGLVFTGKRVDRWVQETSRDGILSLATTRSMYLVASPQERRAMLRRIARVLDAHRETSGEHSELPYVTETWLARPTHVAEPRASDRAALVGAAEAVAWQACT